MNPFDIRYIKLRITVRMIEEGKGKVEKLSAKLLAENHLTGEEIIEILNE